MCEDKELTIEQMVEQLEAMKKALNEAQRNLQYAYIKMLNTQPGCLGNIQPTIQRSNIRCIPGTKGIPTRKD